MDPTANATYDAVAALLAEWRTIFDDEALHLGADEVSLPAFLVPAPGCLAAMHLTNHPTNQPIFNHHQVQYPCWNNSAPIRAWMLDHGVSSLEALEAHFWSRVRQESPSLRCATTVSAGASAAPPPTVVMPVPAPAPAAASTAVFWQEVLDRVPGSLAAGDVVEVWDNKTVVLDVLAAGHRALLADGWYLDRQVPVDGRTSWFWVDTWRDMYLRDPTGGLNLTAAQAMSVLGGEACMWSEQVDAATFDTRVWPRACAVAERLWSPVHVVDLVDASSRLIVHRCRMVAKGIGASPIWADACIVTDDEVAERAP